MAEFVRTEILVEDNIKNRSEKLSKFLDIGQVISNTYIIIVHSNFFDSIFITCIIGVGCLRSLQHSSRLLLVV